MSYKQVKSFNLSKMGTRTGYCLANVRSAFGVKAKYASAKDAMLASKKAGTLHPISTLPKNVAVPVFVDTSSVYEHVEVSDRGTFYSDGKRVSNPYNQRFFGWSETLNDERIVEYVADKKTNEEIANEVIAGEWGNGSDRKARLEKAGYKYADVQAIVNKKLGGGSTTTTKANTGIKVGSKVTLKSWVDYNGTRLAKTRNYYFVSEISGDRAVLRVDNVKGAVYAAVKKSNLKEA